MDTDADDRAASSYDDWRAVHASLDDAQNNPPRHLEGEQSFVYDWPDEPVPGAMLIPDPLRELDDGFPHPHSTTVVLLLQVSEDSGVLGVSLNTGAAPHARIHVPLGLDDVPVAHGGDREQTTIIAVYPTPDGRDDFPRINMEGLSFVIGAAELQRKLLWGHVNKDKLRLYAGFRYWEAGSLEAEIKEERWLMIMATKNFVFDIQPTSVYYHLLEKLGCM